MKRSVIFVLMLLILTVLSAFNSHGEKGTVLPDLMNPTAIYVHSSGIYIQEGHTLTRYDRESLRIKQRIGKKGEGPGEFKSPPAFYFIDNTIFADARGKYAYFSTGGKLIKETRKPGRGPYIPLQGNMVFQKISFDLKSRTTPIEVMLVDNAGKTIKSMYNGVDENVDMVFSSDSGKEVKRMTPHLFYVTANHHRVFVVDTKKGFFIEMFDGSGSKIRTIRRDTEKVRVPESYKKKAMEKMKRSKLWPHMKNNNFLFYEFFPAIRNLTVDNTLMYVETPLEKNNQSQFLVLDMEGNLLKQVFLPARGNIYTFRDGIYYYLHENEEKEEWELHRKKVI